MSNPSVLVPNIHQHVQKDPKNQRMTASVTSRGNSARCIFSSRVWSTGENVERIRLNPRIKARSLLRVRPALRAPRQTVRECVGSDACAVFARTHTDEWKRIMGQMQEGQKISGFKVDHVRRTRICFWTSRTHLWFCAPIARSRYCVLYLQLKQ